MPQGCGARPTGLAWARRAVFLWAVLAGLFLMHGAASPTACCQGGTPVSAMTVIGMPVTPVPAVASAAVGQVRDSCGGGMLCSSRPPAGAHAGAAVIPQAGLAVLAAAPAPAWPAALLRRPCSPPGKPGLPLPLFLGVLRM